MTTPLPSRVTIAQDLAGRLWPVRDGRPPVPNAWPRGEYVAADTHSTVVQERAFLLARMARRDWRWCGVSSDSMVEVALTGQVERICYPSDPSDLLRCLVTREVAPRSMHAAMDRALVAFVAHVEQRYPGGPASAREDALKHAPAVAEIVATVGQEQE